MRGGVVRGTARALLALAVCGAAGPGYGAQPVPDFGAKAAESRPAGPPPNAAAPQTNPSPAGPTPAVTPAAGPAGQPCGAQAARFGDSRGFDLAVVRIGQVRIENPLRPLTPEIDEVLQVVVGGKVATVYGPNLSELRRGGAPAAVEAMLGGPIRWQAALPALPDPLALVAEDGRPLAALAFRTCEPPPQVSAPPQARKGPVRDGKGAGKGGDGRNGQPKAAQRTPPGFSMPQGAIAE